MNISPEKTKDSSPNPKKEIIPIKNNCTSEIIITDSVLSKIEKIYKYLQKNIKRYDIKEVQKHLTGDLTEIVLKFLGYEIGYDHKFKMRPNESTPSTSIRDDGLIRDFGNDWSGRLVNFLMEVYSIDFITAFKYIQNLFGKSNKIANKTTMLPNPKDFEKRLTTIKCDIR